MDEEDHPIAEGLGAEKQRGSPRTWEGGDSGPQNKKNSDRQTAHVVGCSSGGPGFLAKSERCRRGTQGLEAERPAQSLT